MSDIEQPTFANNVASLQSHEALTSVAERIRGQAKTDLDVIVADLILHATKNHRFQEDDCPRGLQHTVGACEEHDTAVVLALSWLLNKTWED